MYLQQENFETLINAAELKRMLLNAFFTVAAFENMCEANVERSQPVERK